jgi:hypothetical protein
MSGGAPGIGNVVLDDGTGAGIMAWTVPAWVAAHAVLDGAVHTDSTASGVTQGDLIVGNATPAWDDLAIGGAGTVLTSDGTDPSWQAPAVPAGVMAHLAEATVTVKGGDYTAIAGPAVVADAMHVWVSVSCRDVNGGCVWDALSSPQPIADMVTYKWIETAIGGLEIRVYNDTVLDILCTVFYCDLG